MALNLKAIPSIDLELELKSRRDAETARVALAKAQKLEKIQILMGNKLALEMLMLLLPDHARATCKGDEEDPVNVHRCTRCTVLDAIKHGDDEVLYNISLNLY